MGTFNGLLAFGGEIFDQLGDFFGEKRAILMGMFFDVLLLLHFTGLYGNHQFFE